MGSSIFIVSKWEIPIRFGYWLHLYISFLTCWSSTLHIVAKILSTYIDGMFLQTDISVIEDPKTHVMLREADPDEPGAITKMRPRFQCMEKSSKRWSSGYHTIVSHSDIKSVVHAYPGCLLSYFDINKYWCHLGVILGTNNSFKCWNPDRIKPKAISREDFRQ